MGMNWGSMPQDQIIAVNQLLDQLKEYDIDVYNHCVRVSLLCRFLAEHAQLTEYDALVAQFAGLLHDVGKMKVPVEIINKPAKLNEEEYNLVKEHPIMSAELVEPLTTDPFFKDVQIAILHHHERVDGKGYPYGLQGEEVPYISRLILIVDTVDAMTQTRAYRKGLPMDVVYHELDKFAGTQFDADLVSIFIQAHMEFGDPIKDNVIKMPFLVNAA